MLSGCNRQRWTRCPWRTTRLVRSGYEGQWRTTRDRNLTLRSARSQVRFLPGAFGLRSSKLLATLPFADLVLGHAVEDAVRVVDAKPSRREPPLHRPPDCGAAAPAVRVAATLVVVRIVNPLDERSFHVPTTSRTAHRSAVLARLPHRAASASVGEARAQTCRPADRRGGSRRNVGDHGGI
jgi:hypothetical protein